MELLLSTSSAEEIDFLGGITEHLKGTNGRIIRCHKFLNNRKAETPLNSLKKPERFCVVGESWTKAQLSVGKIGSWIDFNMEQVSTPWRSSKFKQITETSILQCKKRSVHKRLKERAD